MDKLLNKYFWVLQGLFVVVAALILAAAASGVAASFAMPFTIALPSADDGSEPIAMGAPDEVFIPDTIFPQEPAPEPEPDRCADVECGEDQICNPTTGQCEDEPEVEEEEEIVLDGRCVDSDIAVNLVGTMVTVDPRFSVAILHNPTLDQTQFARVGDQLLAEAEVLSVERNRVLLRRNGEEECLRYGDQSERSSRRNEQTGGRSNSGSSGSSVQENRPDRNTGNSASVSSNQNNEEDSGPSAGGNTFEERLRNGVQRNSDGSYDVDRSIINEVAENDSLLQQQAPRVSPNYVNGRPTGLRLDQMRSDSMFSRIGLRNNDVLLSVNGTDINTTQRAAQLVESMQSQPTVVLTVLRRGREYTIRYNID